MKNTVMCNPCAGGGFTGNSGDLEEDACRYCNGLGSLTEEQASKIKICFYCDEIVEKVNPTPIVADIAMGAKMCRHCWDIAREDIKGTYGRDIGGFEQ